MEKILSICIPVFNGGETAYQHIKEILSYEKSDIEIIVSDNASTDDTLELLKRIDDERLKIITHKENNGPFLNWYYALMAGTAKYVMLFQDNDRFVTKNLPQYLRFLKDVNYDVIRNTSGLFKGKTGELTVAQVQYYNVLYSHVSNVMYRREALHSIKPLKSSFDMKYILYPYVIWDTQILMKYSLDAKKAYMNGDITIKYSPITYKDKASRTEPFVTNEEPSYSYKNISKCFLKYIEIVRDLYPKEKDYCKLLCNSYRIHLWKATTHFYIIMNTPESRWMKKRYGLDTIDETTIDYIKLNDDFWELVASKTYIHSFALRIVTIMQLKVITIHNKNDFILNYGKKMKFHQKYLRKQLNKLLNVLIDRMCK